MISTHCISCVVQRQAEKIEKFEDEMVKSRYMKEILSVIGASEDNVTTPVLSSRIRKVYTKFFGDSENYDEEKKEFNALVMERSAGVWKKINEAEDKLEAAIQYARCGNYIDFGALKEVTQEKFDELLDQSSQDKLDAEEYAHFRKELETGRKLVYLTDNTGEIVLDKLLIQVIKELYPHLEITVIVRGEDVLNDATMMDAEMIGLTDIVKVIGNGTDMAGTPLDYIPAEVRAVLDEADVLIAKGQGNFESMNRCGLNVYYMFLCKCSWFVKQFHMEQFKGVFINDRRL